LLTSLCLAGPPALAWSAQDDRAPEIALIQEYGSNGQLTFDGMRRYLRDKAFVPLDVNQDSVLDVDEYRAARLYARSGACAADGVVEQFQRDKEKAIGNTLTANTLYEVQPLWRKHIDDTTSAHWRRTGAKDDKASIGVEEVRAYLAAENARKIPPIAAARSKAMRELHSKAANPNDAETTIRRFLQLEAFARVDDDSTGSVDFFEFAAAFPTPEASREFCIIDADGDSTLRQEEFLTDTNASAPLHQRTLLALVKNTLDFVLIADVPTEQLTRTEQIFQEEERSATAEARLRSLSRRGYVPGFGYLVRGQRKLEDKKIVHDPNLPTVFIRVIKDFTIDDPRTAEPATFSLVKEKDKDATVAMDVTMQVDFKPASRTFRGLSAGVDLERNTAPSALRHRQRYYTMVNFFFFNAGQTLEAQSLRIAPFVENDDRKDVTRLAGAVIWVPVLHIGRFLTNAYRPLGPHGRWYLVPRGVLELASVIRGGDDEEDGTHARLELLWGLDLYQRFNVTFKTFQRTGIDNDLGHSHFEELSAWWNVDDLKRFSFKTSLSWGKASATDDDEGRKFTAGIGVRF
jgi:hypothetical protein